MKTPREILLERHQAAEAKLDALRREVLDAELGLARPRAAERLNWLAALWEQLFWPCRHAWAGVAAVWVCILALHALSHGEQAPRPLRAKATSPEVMALLREQNHLRLELLDIPAAEPPRTAHTPPGPRSERQPAARTRLDAPFTSVLVPAAEVA